MIYEFVHLDDIESSEGIHRATYEPLEQNPLPFSQSGHIYLVDTNLIIQFYFDSFNRLVFYPDDLILLGCFDNILLRIVWKTHPKNHYLKVCYTINNKKFNWKKEGF